MKLFIPLPAWETPLRVYPSRCRSLYPVFTVLAMFWTHMSALDRVGALDVGTAEGASDVGEPDGRDVVGAVLGWLELGPAVGSVLGELDVGYAVGTVVGRLE